MGTQTSWKDAIKLPVIGKKIGWSLAGLEDELSRSIAKNVRLCFFDNCSRLFTSLSGGLDSSFSLFKARQIVGASVPIYTVTVGGSDKHPDIIHARVMSKQLKTIHHEIIPTLEEQSLAKSKIESLWDEEASLGDVAVFLAYQKFAELGCNSVITHDGIDELLGGYWDHRSSPEENEMAAAFRSRWARLESEHLDLLCRKAGHFGIHIHLPYLDENVVRYITGIPIKERTSYESSKIPLRTIASKYLPKSIIERKKYGFCSALDV